MSHFVHTVVTQKDDREHIWEAVMTERPVGVQVELLHQNFIKRCMLELLLLVVVKVSRPCFVLPVSAGWTLKERLSSLDFSDALCGFSRGHQGRESLLTASLGLRFLHLDEHVNVLWSVERV